MSIVLNDFEKSQKGEVFLVARCGTELAAACFKRKTAELDSAKTI